MFFRKQDNLTDDLQKQLVHRMGLRVGKPPSSTLHIHPILNNTSEFGVSDAEISHISSVARSVRILSPRKRGYELMDVANQEEVIRPRQGQGSEAI